jgi:hypothetical protein
MHAQEVVVINGGSIVQQYEAHYKNKSFELCMHPHNSSRNNECVT